MKIGVIGGGVVGHATARCFMEYHEVRVFDVDLCKATHSLGDTLFTDITFLCLPTPQKTGSLECVTAVVEEVLSEIKEINSDGLLNLVLRSTVPIGFTRRMSEKYGLKNLVHSPEFLTARCAVTDAQLPARNIIGLPCDNLDHRWSITDDGTRNGAEPLQSLLIERFPGVPVHVVSSDESEAIKLITNAFFAVKIAFFNEMHMLAEKMGLNWQHVLEGVLSDGRISHSHTHVPGPDGKFGFGGACLPKDLASLVYQQDLYNLLTFDRDVVKQAGYGTISGLCKAALERNDLDRLRKAGA